MAEASASIALSWPNTTAFRSRSRLASALRSSRRHAARRDARDLGDDLLDLGLADDLLLLGLGRDALRRAGLVDHVDRLVGQVAVVDVARRELGRGGERVGGVLHAVVRLEAASSAPSGSPPSRRSTARPRRSSGSGATARGPSRTRRGTRCRSWRRCTSAGRWRAPASAGWRRRACRPRPRPRRSRVWISSMNRIAFGLSTSCFSTAFRRCSKSPRYLVPASSAPMSSAYTVALGEQVGHVAFDDAPREALGDRGLAHAGFADQQRIVLAAAAQRLHHALELLLAADQRIDLAGERERVQVLRVVVERAVRGLGLGFLLGVLVRFLPWCACGVLVMPCEM